MLLCLSKTLRIALNIMISSFFRFFPKKEMCFFVIDLKLKQLLKQNFELWKCFLTKKRHVPLLFFVKYFPRYFLAFSNFSSTSLSFHPAPSVSGDTAREKIPLYSSSESLIRSDSSGMVHSPGKSPVFSSFLSEIYTNPIVVPRRTNVFIRSIPLDGSTFAIESAVCSVIF